MRIFSIVGARSNFVKIAPLMREMRRDPEIVPILVRGDRQWDKPASDPLLSSLDLVRPDFDLGVESGSHAEQTGEVMKRLGPILDATRPDLILVVGDGNAALAAALTAVKLGIPVAHLEAGLRSFDRTASGEINRLLTDAISDYLFATEQSGEQNLLREGISSEKIHLVGTSWWMPFGCSGPIGRARQYSTTWAWTPTLPIWLSPSAGPPTWTTRSWFARRLPELFHSFLGNGNRLADVGIRPSSVQVLMDLYFQRRREEHCRRLWALLVLDRSLHGLFEEAAA